MTKNEILAKVNELISAYSVCAPIKEAAEAYVKNRIRTRNQPKP